MANIIPRIEEFEDNFIENIANFVDEALGLPMYDLGKPFIKPTEPYIGIKIIDTGDSNGWSSKWIENDGQLFFAMDTTIRVEINAFRGRPLMTLTYLLSAFRGFDELRYKHLYSKNIGFLSASNVTDSSARYDGDKTEPRSRMVATFNVTILCDDLSLPPEIERIKYETNSYVGSYDEAKLSLDGEFIYTT